MSNLVVRYTPRRTTPLDGQSTRVHSPQRRNPRQHDHCHRHVHHHGHGRGGHHRHQFAIRVIRLSGSTSRKASRSKRDRRSASRARGEKKRTASTSSETAVEEEDEVEDQRTTVRQPCRLCRKLRELSHRSRDLTTKTESSDVTVAASDRKLLYCHSFVVEVWAPDLLKRPRVSAEGKREWTIEVDDFDSDVVGACLSLMYGGSVDGAPLEILTKVMELADAYQIPDLKSACSRVASVARFTPANVFELWGYARTHDSDQLRQRATRYLLDNIGEIRKNKEWKDTIRKPQMLLDLFYAISGSTTPKRESIPPRDTQMDELWARSDGLRTPCGYSDATVVTKQGKTFFVHLPLIALTSPKFANMLHAEKNGTGAVVIDDFDEDVVEEFLRCLYHQEPSASFPELAEYVYVMACDFEAESVADSCERRMAESQLRSIESAIACLKEAEEHRMPATKSTCFRYLYDVGSDQRSAEQWRQFAVAYPAVIAEMIVNWEEYRQRKGE